MSDMALVKRPVGDDLAIKVKAYKDEQVANREKEKAPFKRQVLIESFLRLSYRYFGLPREFVKNLSKEERAELLKKVFEEVKSRLRWRSPLIHAMLALTIIGLLRIFTIHNDKKMSFPAFKVRRLYDWYMKNYGADDLEKAVKSGDFDKKTLVNAHVLASVNFQIKKPEAHEIILPSIADNIIQAMEKADKSIGFCPSALLEYQLSCFFREKGIKVFEYQDIHDYLTDGAKKINKSWYWRALREKDFIKKFYNQGTGGWKESYCLIYGRYDNSSPYCRPYSKAIPYRVVDIVEEIIQKFGDKVIFLVGQYTDSSEKYIAAVATDIKWFIFDSWHDDELKQPSS